MQRIEGVRTFAGQTVTVSFYAKAAASITLPKIDLQQNFGTGGSPSASVTNTIVTNLSIGTTSTKYIFTVTLPSISGKTLGSDNNDMLVLDILLPLNTTFTFDIAQVQVEAGPVATPFERRPIGTELALCQRYFQSGFRSFNSYGFTGWGYTSQFTFPVTMRVTPTMSHSVSNLNNIATTNIGAYDRYTGFLEATLSSNNNAFYFSFFTASAEL